MRQIQILLLVCLFAIGPIGCVGTVISAVADATIAVAKVPFKAGAAVVDVAIPDDDDDD
jgi:hypothetical protein